MRCYIMRHGALQRTFLIWREQAELWQQAPADTDRWDAATGEPQLAKVQEEAARSLLSQVLHRDKHKRPTSSAVVSHAFFSADARALGLLQELEQERQQMARQQADHAAEVQMHQQQMQEGQQSIAAARERQLQEFSNRQARLEEEEASLKRKRQELASAGERSQEVQEQLQEEARRLQAKREKMGAEKRKQEQELRRREVDHADRKRKEEAKLASHWSELEKRKAALGEREMEAAKKEMKAAAGALFARVPKYWKNKTGFHRVPSNFVMGALQKFLVESSSCCNGAASRATVVSVERIENESLWHMYQTRRSIVQKRLAGRNNAVPKLSSKMRWQPTDMPSTQELSADVNELYLFHGTSATTAGIIAEHGFDERVASLNGLYGAGSYFAINGCKSHQYAGATAGSGGHVMLVCRVTLGIPFCTTRQHKNARRPPDNPATPGRPHDSIYAEGGVANGGDQRHNEYIVFDSSQVYPEYVVHYRV